MVKWSIRYAGAESDSWEYLPCTKGGKYPDDFKTFKMEVKAKYPQLDEARRHTLADLEAIIEKMAQTTKLSREDLGKYEREFLTCTEYLIKNHRLSYREQNTAYLRGLPQSVRERVLQCLAIKRADVLPEDGYEFSDVHEAALFVLSSGRQAFADPTSSSALIKHENPSQSADVNQFMSTMMKAFNSMQPSSSQPPSTRLPYQSQQLYRPQQQQSRPTPGGVHQNPQMWARPLIPGSPRCIFCSDEGHLV